MNKQQDTPTNNEIAMQETLEAAQKVAPPWALPLTLDDIDLRADEDGRDVFYWGENFAEQIEGDSIVRLSQISTFDADGNLVRRGNVEPCVNIRDLAFSSTDLVALCLALSKLHDALTADEVE